MSLTNLERMIALAGQVFDTKNDPDQLDVTPEIIERLHKLHPYTISEKTDGDGPVAWVLVIPTTSEIMNRFLSGEITENELFELTEPGQMYDTLYLCSALVLEEYRRKGISRELTINAIEEIRKGHSLKALFVWPFSEEGDKAAEMVAKLVSLPLFKKES
jgi:hypothetical protein